METTTSTLSSNEPKKLIKFAISVAGSIGRGRYRTPARMYITAVSWADGDGLKAKKFSYCGKKERAYLFAKLTAEGFCQDLKRFRVVDIQLHPVEL